MIAVPTTIQVKELRVGNWIAYSQLSTETKYAQVSGLLDGSVFIKYSHPNLHSGENEVSATANDAQPIPITPELLERIDSELGHLGVEGIASDKIEPILLGPSILAKCGFELTTKENTFFIRHEYSKDVKGYRIVLAIEQWKANGTFDNCCGLYVNEDFCGSVLTLHWLQNLLFFRTGVELEVNLDPSQNTVTASETVNP